MEVQGYIGQLASRQMAGAIPSMPVPSAASSNSLNGDVAGIAARARDSQDGGVFFSPVISYDMLAKVSVMVFRDPETGEVSQQIPSERVVKSYRAQEMRDPATGEVAKGTDALVA